ARDAWSRYAVKGLKGTRKKKLAVALDRDVINAGKERGGLGGLSPLGPAAGVEGVVNGAVRLQTHEPTRRGSSVGGELAGQDNTTVGLNVCVEPRKAGTPRAVGWLHGGSRWRVKDDRKALGQIGRGESSSGKAAVD